MRLLGKNHRGESSQLAIIVAIIVILILLIVLGVALPNLIGKVFK